MRANRLLGPVVAVLLCVAGLAGAAQVGPAPIRKEPAPARKDPARDIMLQTIGMLAGQGLVLGHESLAGVFARYENRLLSREEAGRILENAVRYTGLVLAAFKGRLMGQLAEQERKDLTLLIGFYEAQREAVEALAVYVREGGGGNREHFEKQQERVASVIRRISLDAAGP